jgi:type VI secretion system secreted protein VgrG
MPIILKDQKKLLAKIKWSFGDDVILNSLHGIEEISDLFEFKITLLAKDDSIDLEKALGTSINIEIKSETQKRNIDGIIAEFSQGATEAKTDIYLTEYSAIIRPKLWLLTLDRNHLIFQKKSAIDIIQKILKDNGITDIDDKTKFCGKVERDYCVQYGESSFNFISRLMEDEGIFYFFSHTSSKHTLVLADDSSCHEKILSSPIEFMKCTNNIFPLGKVFNTKIVTSVNTGSYSVADYNYTISKTKLNSNLKTKWSGKEFYEFPGCYSKLKEGDNLSKIRVQLFEFKHYLFNASSTVPNLIPGFSFELTDHHQAKFNKEYTAYKIEHFYDASAKDGHIYVNNFSSFPKKTEFRPERKTPKVRIYGTQTATVTCPNGEEIYRNEHCCIKIQFHWDQFGKNNEESSCWARVSQMLAGNSWGTVFVPRVGQEVVVSFIEGDPDKPIVVGCVYNDQFMPPYTDSESMISCIKTATFKDDEGKMFNEVRFNDEKDKQEIYVHAEKDMYINVLNSRKTEIEEADDILDLFKGNRQITLKADGDNKANHSLFLTKGDAVVELTEGNHNFTITKGNEEVTLKEGNRTITLSKGNLSYDVKGDFTLKVSGNITIKADGNISMEAGKEIKIKSGQALKAESGTEFSVKSGTDFKSESGTKMDIKSGMDLNVEAGMNLKAKSSMNMNLEGGMNFGAKGAIQSKLEGMTVEVAGSVQTKISGAMVEISGTGMTKVGAPMITIGGGMLQLG